MTHGSVHPPPRRRLAGVIAIAGASAIAALTAGLSDLWRSSAAPLYADVAPWTRSTDIDASVAIAVMSIGRASPPPPRAEAVCEETTEQRTLETKPPPCRQYYPACGTFSRSGFVADVECGCHADETCSRVAATGTCVHRPRWMGP